jgi:predicted DNA-binding transcriptional regulator YafY
MQIEGGLFTSESTPVVSFQSNPDLKGLEFFGKLLQAIIKKRVLKIKYAPFGKDSYTEKIYPYHLKQFNDRWYLIAQAIGYQSFAHYALDRIDGFEEIALPYIDAEVDFSEYFDDVIGVTVPDGDAEDIVIKVTGKRFNYIRTKPLHLSQRIIEEAAGYAVITINVKVNNELESLILSFGDDMEVIAPASFRERIAGKIQAMNNKYLNNAENLHSK